MHYTPRLNNYVRLIVPLYLFWECVFANLSVRDMLPEALIETDRSADVGKIIWTWYLCHCVDYNSYTIRLFIMLPFALVSQYL